MINQLGPKPFGTAPLHLFLKSRREAILFIITILFVFINAISLSVVNHDRITWQHIAGPACWLVVYLIAAFLVNRYRKSHDPFMLPVIMLLTGWGILLMDRLAPNFLIRQIGWVILGAVVLTAIAILPRNLRWLRRYRYTWLILGLVLLAITLLFGVNPSGATAANYWLQIPFLKRVFFQPSELLKLLLVIFLASYFDERENLLQNGAGNGRLDALPVIAPLLLMWGFCMLLLVWQRDLGAATLFFLLFLGLLYVATGTKWYVLGGFFMLLLASAFAYFTFDLVALRVDAWLNPWPDADNRSFQIVQSLYAIAAGGLVGQGIGQGFPTYIPVVHSDFAFAAIGEEWGVIGTFTVALCFAFLAHRGLRLAMLADRPFHRYLAAGITILLSTQALLIMGGVTKLFPLTGVTLPFISYGGSSMLISHIMVGLLLFLSTQINDGHI